MQFIWRLGSHTNLKPNYHNSGLGAVLWWGFGAKRLPDQGAKLTTFYRNGHKFVRLYPAWGWSTMKSSNTNLQRPRLCQNFLFWLAVARLLSNSCTLIMTLSHYKGYNDTKSWWRGTVVERRSLAGELSLSCARPAADGWPLMWVSHPL